MGHRGRWACAGTVAVAVLALAACGHQPAGQDAAIGGSWRTVLQTEHTELADLVAVDAHHAYAYDVTGLQGESVTQLDPADVGVESWDGRHWTRGGQLGGAAADALGRGTRWSVTTGGGTQYLVRWDGGWRKVTALPLPVGWESAVSDGGDGAWIVGSTGSALHWVGSRLVTAPLPPFDSIRRFGENAGSDLLNLQVPAAGETWALDTICNPTSPDRWIARWSGTGWQHVPVPAGTPCLTGMVLVHGILSAFGAGVLLSRNGHGWRQVGVPAATAQCLHTGQVDGRGGVWFAGKCYAYYRDGTWSSWPIPGNHGSAPGYPRLELEVTQVVLVPGTRTVLSIAKSTDGDEGGSPITTLIQQYEHR